MLHRAALYPALLGLVAGALGTGLVVGLAQDRGSDQATTAAIAGPASGRSGPPGASGATAVPGDAGSGAGPVTTAAGPRGFGPSRAVAAGAAATTASGEPIRLGMLILDVGGVGKLGVKVMVDPDQERATYQALVDEANAHGGAGGHPIEPVYATYDVTSADSERAACLSLTEDNKVFAVIGGFNFVAANACVAVEHATPLYTNQGMNPDSLYRTAGGRLFSPFARSGRMMAADAAEFGAMGLFNGKVGIVSDDVNDPSGEVTAALVADIRREGHEVARVSRLSGQASSQVAVEVQQQRASGAQFVVLMANLLNNTAFVQGADGQGFRPQYLTTDWSNGYVDSNFAEMPASFDGSVNLTITRNNEFRGNQPEPALAAQCREVYERRSKRALAARGSNEYGLTNGLCDMMRVFLQGMAATRGAASRDSLVAATTRLGPLSWGSWGDGSFAPGKTDAGDVLRTQRWQAACTCWQPDGTFRRARA